MTFIEICRILFPRGVGEILLINITHYNTICTNLFEHWSLMHPRGVWGGGQKILINLVNFK